jgi:hypothetical protein
MVRFGSTPPVGSCQNAFYHESNEDIDRYYDSPLGVWNEIKAHLEKEYNGPEYETRKKLRSIGERDTGLELAVGA